MVCCGLAVLASCEKKVTTEDPSTITHYVSFELNGDETMLVPLNTTFADPGVKATENGVDVNDKVVVSITDAAGDAVSKISTTDPGLYYVEYSAVNVDGFGASCERTVIVYDPSVTVSIAGVYNVDIDASIYNDNPFSAWIAAKGYAGNSAVVEFTEIAPGFFECNDILAGWYSQIRAYGAKYYMDAIVALNSDNTLSLISSYIPGWGDGLDYLENSNYDPETGTLTYDVCYAGQIYISPVLVKQ